MRIGRRPVVYAAGEREEETNLIFEEDASDERVSRAAELVTGSRGSR